MTKIYVSATVTAEELSLTASYTELSATDILLGDFVITRNLADAAAFSDDFDLDLTKYLTDAASFVDTLSFNTSKPLSDTFSVSESEVYSFSKALSDTFYVTDDIDGNASVEDDQNMSFTKKRTDLAFALDNLLVKSIAKPVSDTTIASESGIVRGQSYCDLSYFLEDYVGFLETF